VTLAFFFSLALWMPGVLHYRKPQAADYTHLPTEV
jgi:hypothetical protein